MDKEIDSATRYHEHPKIYHVMDQISDPDENAGAHIPQSTRHSDAHRHNAGYATLRPYHQMGRTLGSDQDHYHNNHHSGNHGNSTHGDGAGSGGKPPSGSRYHTLPAPSRSSRGLPTSSPGHESGPSTSTSPAAAVATCSMRNGMSTTVPQSMVRHDLGSGGRPPACVGLGCGAGTGGAGPSSTTPRSTGGSSHNKPRQPRHQRPRLSTLTSLNKTYESFEMRCCKINVLLVTMQLCLGATITALGFFMQTLTSTLRIRECPFWAGIPVCNTLF